MNKGLIFLFGIVSFLGINTVSAEEKYFEYDTNINNVSSVISDIGYDTFNQYVNDTINYYKTNYFNNYPYYVISFYKHPSADYFYIYLTATNELHKPSNLTFDNYGSTSYDFTSLFSDVIQLGYTYNIADKTTSELNISIGSYMHMSIFDMNSNNNYLTPYSYYYSNFDLYYYGSYLTENSIKLTYLNSDDDLYIPSFDDPSFYTVYKANTDFLIDPYYLFDDNLNIKFEDSKYTEINLNNYPYVALSLKDYNNIPPNNYSVYTNIWVKGQLCITPVYNYGMTERKDILTGTQIQRCSSYFNDFTSTRMYLLKTDIENHSIYYLKAYDTTKDNIVKVDTSVFDISYITEDTKDNPYVNIGGKQYPTISYDKLTDTATKSEDEDYISGVTCPVGDFNCYNEYNNENIFKQIFDKPLEIFKSIFSAISSVFVIITEFISLLPEAMQGFLYLSFSIAIILGLIKIIL